MFSFYKLAPLWLNSLVQFGFHFIIMHYLIASLTQALVSNTFSLAYVSLLLLLLEQRLPA